LIARIAELEALVSSQAAEIARLTALLAQLQAELDALRTAKPSDKNSRNSSVPPSQSYPENRPESQSPTKKGPRHGHPGKSRHRSECARMLREIVAEQPEYGPARVDLAETLRGLGREEEASAFLGQTAHSSGMQHPGCSFR